MVEQDCFISGGSKHDYFFMGYAKLKEAQAWPLEQKVLFAEQLILRELKQAKTPSISCSWGKDSVALVHLVRKFCKKTLIMFADTGVEYPETYAHRDKMVKEWNLNGNYFETKPLKHFWQCVDEYGFPDIRRTGTAKKKEPKCCQYLKEKPLRNLQKSKGVDVVFRGLSAAESMNRRLLTLRMGYAYYHKSQKLRFVHPLAFWTAADVFAYHKQHKIPLNKIYEKASRCGCMTCTGFLDWKEVMEKTNPKLYSYIVKRMESQGDLING